MYGCKSWIIKKAEFWRRDAFELWCWRRLLRVPWTARRSNQSILKEISLEYSLEGLMLKLQYFGHLMQRTDSLEKTLMLGKIKGGRRRGRQRRWLDGISDSMDVSLSGGGQRGLACHSHGVADSRTRLSDWTELNWTKLNSSVTQEMDRTCPSPTPLCSPSLSSHTSHTRSLVLPPLSPSACWSSLTPWLWDMSTYLLQVLAQFKALSVKPSPDFPSLLPEAGNQQKPTLLSIQRPQMMARYEFHSTEWQYFLLYSWLCPQEELRVIQFKEKERSGFLSVMTRWLSGPFHYIDSR